MKMILPSLLLLAAGCAAVPPPALLPSEWGGPHVALHLGPTGGTLDYDCAHGTIGPLLTGPDGRFTAAGTHTPEHGGPVREGEVLPTFTAHYNGAIAADRMTLQGQLENGVQLGPFTLVRGAKPQLFRCM